MCAFVGRKSELGFLEDIFENGRFKTCAIFGRRRIGKTALIAEFCKDKKNLTIPFYKGSEAQNVERISISVSLFENQTVIFKTLSESLEHLKTMAKNDDIVIVFDEYPYFAACEDYISSVIQHFVDWLVDNTSSMLIICGSVMSSMKKEIYNEKSPLYGRFLNHIELKQMPFNETCLFHENMSDRDKVNTYLTLGGVPMYHAMADVDNYVDLLDLYFINEIATLSSEANNILYREFTSGERYLPALSSMDEENNTLKDLSDRSGIENTTMMNYLGDLMSMDIVGMINPMAGAPKRRRYYIRDKLVSFYYNVVFKNQALLFNTRANRYEKVKNTVSRHLSYMFKELCVEYIMNNYPCTEIGKWWGQVPVVDENGWPIKDDKGKTITEGGTIDIIADIREGNNKIDLFVDCKHNSRKTGFSAYESLFRKVNVLEKQGNPRFMLFSLSGFDDDFLDYAKDNGILTIDIECLMGRSPAPKL